MGRVKTQAGHHRNNAPAGHEPGNSRNGTRPKADADREHSDVRFEVPRGRDGNFEPEIVKQRQRRLTGVDEIVLSFQTDWVVEKTRAHPPVMYGDDRRHT